MVINNNQQTVQLGTIPQPVRTYLSYDEILPQCDLMGIPSETINSINQSGLPVHKLKLKTGCSVILLRNINPKIGLCNGTRLIIKELHNNLVVCEIVNGKFKSNIVEIFRTTNFSDDQQPIQFKRVQFPIALASVLSINKSQGQTYERVGVFLYHNIFAHGQLYVALSRGRYKKNIKVFLSQNNQMVTNIVHPEIICD